MLGQAGQVRDGESRPHSLSCPLLKHKGCPKARLPACPPSHNHGADALRPLGLTDTCLSAHGSQRASLLARWVAEGEEAPWGQEAAGSS